ncbi:ABC transporter permease [Liquorilactobacillus satsumensis]|uniref:ABC transporter permease n=1 Tax=Liquorilactobacillus satsumensis TaxID=259059 RepID=UPI001E59ECA2|nr:ABC transporter permease [Liquorilactobacillus satsumensis]MCC7666199.1 peptide ABC transporter permease [Liquorilactobacillus satsumensis]MCP9313489.1 ABC transporter permease [Liquorilactobacillus satsumensis]MCP9329119.1 ABC transporter permease [Liquorilactobacillus satsumensis]MCP9357780.1 ABC transporter permease [Liquorilactobacillus satsumensis]MCP9360114.1 ABC transporter permease [Liquorilactobacillus satsumensis]
MEEKLKLSPDSFEALPQAQEPDNEKIAAPSLTFVQDAWRRLKMNKGALISFWIIILMMIVAFGSSFFINHSTLVKSAPQYANLPAKIPGVPINGFNGKLKVAGQWVDEYKQNNVPTGKYFILGTDNLGHSLAQRIVYGTKISLIVALVATFFDLTIGVAYGIISGWRGGRVDTVMQRIIEIISSIPSLVIVVLMLIVLRPGMTSIIAAIAISSWTTMARMIRAETLQLKSQEYVLAARSLGESPFKIAWKHLVPNLSSVIIIQTMYTIPTAIFFEAFLSFIGIGISSPETSLGVLLNDGQKNFQFLPYQMWYPAIVLCILMIAFNLLGDGLRDAFDPKSRR